MEICLYFYDHKYYKCLSILSVSTHIGRLSNRVKRLNVQNTLKKWFHGETLSLFVLPFSRVIFYVLLSNVFQYLQKKALLIQLFVYKFFLYCIWQGKVKIIFIFTVFQHLKNITSRLKGTVEILHLTAPHFS